MPSPFPGMNPYFEQPDRWPGFQLEFIAQLRRQLAAQAPADYVVDVEEHISIQELPEGPRDRRGQADVPGFEQQLAVKAAEQQLGASVVRVISVDSSARPDVARTFGVLVRYIGTVTRCSMCRSAMPSRISACSNENEQPIANTTRSSRHNSSSRVTSSVRSPWRYT